MSKQLNVLFVFSLWFLFFLSFFIFHFFILLSCHFFCLLFQYWIGNIYWIIERLEEHADKIHAFNKLCFLEKEKEKSTFWLPRITSKCHTDEWFIITCPFKIVESSRPKWRYKLLHVLKKEFEKEPF